MFSTEQTQEAMEKRIDRFAIAFPAALTCLTTVSPVSAQIVPDNTLPVNSRVRSGCTVCQIEGGTVRGSNLFHSFREFSVPLGGEAIFNNAPQIENIFSRVTGSNLSYINGWIRANGTANLFLLNPNGIVFGLNAQLDIKGSFLASTASSFTFPDGSEFGAINPQAPPLLTISVPLGLQYGSNPGNIEVRGSNLQVNLGQTLALIGGNVSMDEGRLQAAGGRIELGGLAGAGTVQFNADSSGNLFSSSFPDGVERADFSMVNNRAFSLINQAEVDVAAGSGGSIAVTVRNLDISDGGKINAGIGENLGLVDAVAGDINVNATGTVSLQERSAIQNQVNFGGIGNAGNINVNAGRTVTLRGSSVLQNIVDHFAIGNGGNINVNAGSLYLLTGSQLYMSSFGQGSPGTINVNVRDLVSADSGGDNASTSGIINSFVGTVVGKAGDINITTGSLSVTNGAQLNSITFTNGNGGNVNINARDTVSFDGANVGASGILTAVRPEAVGNGGDINITAGSVSITNGAQLNPIVRGRGNAGNVNINARNTVLIDGFNQINEDANASGILTAVGIKDDGTPGVGDGGDINITTGSLSISNGAQLNAITRGEGNAGNIIINARDRVSLDGFNQKNGASSGIFASVDIRDNGTQAVGNGGDININTRSLVVTNGAELNAITRGQGNAGNIIINAQDLVSLDGEKAINGTVSQILTSVDSNENSGDDSNLGPAVGNGGRITITTGSLSITGGAALNAVTAGRGNAGDVIVNAGDAVFINGQNSKREVSGVFSSVAENAVGNGGNIDITTQLFSATQGGGVFARSSGEGDAGNLTVTAPQAVILSSGSSLSVDTSGVGKAGNITISTETLNIEDGAGVIASATETATSPERGSIGVNASVVNLSGQASRLEAETQGITPAGELTLQPFNGGQTLTVNLQDGAGISASTSGSGGGGTLRVTAPEAVTIRGNGLLSVETTNAGIGGNLIIETGRLTVIDEATVSASTSSPAPEGVGGNLTVNATQSLNLSNGASLLARSEGSAPSGNTTVNTGQLTITNSGIETSSEESSGGNINITADQIRLLDDSEIRTSVNQGAGDGGNINLTADSILAFDNSDILAFANDGQGGDITLDSPAFFGENYTPASRNTNTDSLDNNNQVDVNATGAVSGVIVISDTTFIQNSLADLPENQINTDTLLANSCIVRRDQPRGSFIITGTGGLPQRPGNMQMSTFSTVDVETLPDDNKSSTTNPRRPWQAGDRIVEPQGLYRLPNGKLVLSRECPE